MIAPSPSSPVPLFHSPGNGTVEHTLNQRNNVRNMGGTYSLKALASKVLEQNNKGNNRGTTTSKPVPPLSQSSIACGTSAEAGCKDQTDSFLCDFEEQIAIAEVDGNQTPIEAHRIAYLDAFIAILSDLAENNPHQDWLAQQIQRALATLEAQNFPTPNRDFSSEATFINSFPNI